MDVEAVGAEVSVVAARPRLEGWQVVRRGVVETEVSKECELEDHKTSDRGMGSGSVGVMGKANGSMGEMR